MTTGGSIERDVKELLGGIPVRRVEASLELDKPAPLRQMAIASVRGLAGKVLMETDPELFHAWFKPKQSGNAPPAYLFEANHEEFQIDDSVPFALVTWDPDDALLEGLIDAFQRAKGYEFGESGARVRDIKVGNTQRLAVNEPSSGDRSGPYSLHTRLKTPVRIKSDNRWVSENELDLTHLLRAGTRRLNHLSQAYGNGQQLDPDRILAGANDIPNPSRDLRWVRPRRRSATQQGDLSLSGVVGSVTWDSVPGELISLLQAACLFHIGSHAADGCGQIEAEATERRDRKR